MSLPMNQIYGYVSSTQHQYWLLDVPVFFVPVVGVKEKLIYHYKNVHAAD